MPWSYRPDQDPQEQLKDIEDSLGIQNLRDVAVKDDSGTMYLYVYTDTKTYRVGLTEV